MSANIPQKRILGFTPFCGETGHWHIENDEVIIAVGKRPELAHLLAAAPDLYEACALALEWAECQIASMPHVSNGDLEVLGVIQEAIAKTKGGAS